MFVANSQPVNGADIAKQTGRVLAGIGFGVPSIFYFSPFSLECLPHEKTCTGYGGFSSPAGRLR
jgi:hypothetical protein